MKLTASSTPPYCVTHIEYAVKGLFYNTLVLHTNGSYGEGRKLFWRIESGRRGEGSYTYDMIDRDGRERTPSPEVTNYQKTDKGFEVTGDNEFHPDLHPYSRSLPAPYTSQATQSIAWRSVSLHIGKPYVLSI